MPCCLVDHRGIEPRTASQKNYAWLFAFRKNANASSFATLPKNPTNAKAFFGAPEIKRSI